MGMVNPETGKYEAIRRTITHDNRPARKAFDVIAFELESGTVVGFEEFKKYDEERRAILQKFNESRIKNEQEMRSHLGQLYKNWTARMGGD
jgi:hypothetical protein